MNKISLKEAAQRFQNAAADLRLRPDAYAGLGETLARMGREKEAYEVWIQALETKLDGAHTERIAAMTGAAYHTERLTRGEYDSYYPRFHPDGKSLVFTSHQYESADLFRLRFINMSVERLTQMDDANELSPAFFLDGKTLLFAATQRPTNDGYIEMNVSGSSGRRMQIMKRDAPSAPVQPLTPNPSSVGNPFPHPSKKRILFDAAPDENLDIWTMDVESGARTRLTDGPEDDEAPVYTPDGRAILFVRTTEGVSNLMTANADGTEPTEVTRTPYNDHAGSFSPDGRRMVYFRQRGSYELAMMDWDARRSIVLRRTRGNATMPVFSPDGRFIVYVSDESDYMELYRLDLSRPVSGAALLRRLRSVFPSLRSTKDAFVPTD